MKPTTREEAAAICLKWARCIGGGFHPDTRGREYVWTMPGVRGRIIAFTTERAAEYDLDMDRLFEFDGDPYALAVEAMEIEEAAR